MCVQIKVYGIGFVKILMMVMVPKTLINIYCFSIIAASYPGAVLEKLTALLAGSTVKAIYVEFKFFTYTR